MTTNREGFEAILANQLRKLIVDGRRRFVDAPRPMLSRELKTIDVFWALRTLGYDASRQRLDDAIRRRGFSVPKANRKRMAWTIEDAARFGADLEARRAWLPGFYNSKKTWAELDHDSATTSPDRRTKDVTKH